MRAVNATYTTDFYEVGSINSDVRNSICLLSSTSIRQKCSIQLWDVHITLRSKAFVDFTVNVIYIYFS